jgi:hypothetical protein
MTEVPYVRQPADFSGPIRYAYGPDSYPQPGVPRGTILDYDWNESRVFPGTSRRYWVYVPVQYAASEPASLMVFQDGQGHDLGAFPTPAEDIIPIELKPAATK